MTLGGSNDAHLHCCTVSREAAERVFDALTRQHPRIPGGAYVVLISHPLEFGVGDADQPPADLDLTSCDPRILRMRGDGD